MEQIKIQMNEIESMTLKIPTEFTGYSFSKFYDQLLLIGKSMPDLQLHSSITRKGLCSTPERFSLVNWKDKEQALDLLKVWAEDGRHATIEWFKEKREWELTREEISKLSLLMVAIRQKYVGAKK